MRQSEVADFKSILDSRLSELMWQLTRREGIAIEKTPDALDAVQVAGERELATRSLERGSSVLREVRAALARIERGQFGQCLDCEEEISHKRLRAVPWTPRCLTCQTQEDQSKSRYTDQPEWMSVRAA